MSEIKENVVTNEDWKVDSDNWIWIFLLLMLFGGWGNYDNPRISELEKKVARLEGQMSMIGRKSL